MVLSSLEKGQDQNDEKLQKEKMSLSEGTFILNPSVPLLKESVWVSKALRMSRTQTPHLESWLHAPLSFQNVLY